MIDIIYKSANKLGYLEKIAVISENACSFEEYSEATKFNLAYIDPPYGKNPVSYTHLTLPTKA